MKSLNRLSSYTQFLLSAVLNVGQRSVDSTILYGFYERLNLWLLAGDALTIDFKD